MNYIGEIAAIFTSFCWTMSAVGFSGATQEFGSQVTNRVRVVVAMLALLVINALLYGQAIPLNAGASHWLWLTASGLVGLALGDAFLFSAYQQIGPRLGLLLLSLAPIFGAGLAWAFFGETLTRLQLGGVIITLAGISWVVFARPEQDPASTTRHKVPLKGILFGVLAAFGQGAGMVLSKQGMADNFPPFAGTLIRMLAAVLALWLVALFQGQAGKTVQAVREKPRGLQWVLFGAFFGPVIGISASLLAIQYAEVGVASTLMALPPIFMLPISYFFYKEKVNLSSLMGTFVAMGGVALLFFK